MQTSPADAVLDQIRRLEKRVAALRRRQAAGVLCLLALAGLSMSPASQPGADTVVARTFIVVDEAGNRVAQLGSDNGKIGLALGGFEGGMPTDDGAVPRALLGVDKDGVMFSAKRGTVTGASELLWGVRDGDVMLTLSRGVTARVGALVNDENSAVVLVAPDGSSKVLKPE